jgi:transposase
MESIGVYWKCDHYPLEGLFRVVADERLSREECAGAQTDVAEAEWLADVAAHGTVRPSFVRSADTGTAGDLPLSQDPGECAIPRGAALGDTAQNAGIKISSVASRCWVSQPGP